MYLKHLFKNSGFSLIELTVSVAIAGGIGLLAAKLLSDQQMNQNQVRLISEVDKMQALIQTALKKPSVCNATFAAATVRVGTIDFFKVDNITDGPKIVFKSPSISDANWAGAGRQEFRIESIKLRNPTEATGATSAYAAVSDAIKEVVVTYEFHREYMSNPTMERKFNIFMTMDPANGRFRECGSVIEDTNRETLMKMCQALGTNVAEWVEFSNYSSQLYTDFVTNFGGLAAVELAYPDGKCQLLDTRCDESQNQVAMRIDSLGGWVCKPVSERLQDIHEKVDTSTQNCSGKSNFFIESVGGKLRINCY